MKNHLRNAEVVLLLKVLTDLSSADDAHVAGCENVDMKIGELADCVAARVNDANALKRNFR